MLYSYFTVNLYLLTIVSLSSYTYYSYICFHPPMFLVLFLAFRYPWTYVSIHTLFSKCASLFTDIHLHSNLNLLCAVSQFSFGNNLFPFFPRCMIFCVLQSLQKGIAAAMSGFGNWLFLIKALLGLWKAGLGSLLSSLGIDVTAEMTTLASRSHNCLMARLHLHTPSLLTKYFLFIYILCWLLRFNLYCISRCKIYRDLIFSWNFGYFIRPVNICTF